MGWFFRVVYSGREGRFLYFISVSYWIKVILGKGVEFGARWFFLVEVGRFRLCG